MNIQKTLFREFSCLLNYDIENQIRKNTNALCNIDIEDIKAEESHKEGEIDNLLYQFYQSLTRMFSSQPEVRELDKRVNEKFDISGLNYAKIYNDRINERRL